MKERHLDRIFAEAEVRTYILKFSSIFFLSRVSYPYFLLTILQCRYLRNATTVSPLVTSSATSDYPTSSTSTFNFTTPSPFTSSFSPTGLLTTTSG